MIPAIEQRLDAIVDRWLEYHHGDGQEHEHYYFRCEGCRQIVTWRDIRLGGCDCGSNRLRPAAIRGLEQWRVILLPWTIGTRSKRR